MLVSSDFSYTTLLQLAVEIGLVQVPRTGSWCVVRLLGTSPHRAAQHRHVLQAAPEQATFLNKYKPLNNRGWESSSRRATLLIWLQELGSPGEDAAC